MKTGQLPPDLLTVPEAAKRLGISQATAYRLARKGTLPGLVRIGHQLRVSVPRLERHLHEEPQEVEVAAS